MNKHTKFNLRSMIIVILALAACSASPSLATATNPEPTLPEVNPFDPTPTSKTQPGAEQPNTGMSIGGYKGGCNVHYPDYTFTYDDSPIQIPCQFEGTGFDTEVGLMFFLDGFPQPHQITETDESDPSTETGQEVFMSKHRFSKDGSISFTVSITPVTGKAGDELSLFMTRVWEREDLIIATHIVPDVESIAQSIVLINHGSIILSGSPNELIHKIQGKVWTLEVTPQDVDRFIGNYKISNIQLVDNVYTLRIVSDFPPEEQAKPTQPKLEEAYIYYTEGAIQ